MSKLFSKDNTVYENQGNIPYFYYVVKIHEPKSGLPPVLTLVSSPKQTRMYASEMIKSLNENDVFKNPSKLVIDDIFDLSDSADMTRLKLHYATNVIQYKVVACGYNFELQKTVAYIDELLCDLVDFEVFGSTKDSFVKSFQTIPGYIASTTASQIGHITIHAKNDISILNSNNLVIVFDNKTVDEIYDISKQIYELFNGATMSLRFYYVFPDNKIARINIEQGMSFDII